MKASSKFIPKNEKGQVLVIVALVLVGLVAIIGLAIDTGYMYVSYARLRRGVDAAALAGTGEFKIPPGYNAPCIESCAAIRDNNIRAAAKQMLDLNKVVPDSTAGFSDAMSGVAGISIETCENTPGDAVLCAAPLQKIIRVKVQERVPLFFLTVIGLRNVPIVIDSLATAASADIMLAIDTSDSMTYDVPRDDVMRDPHACNPNDCHPMEEVKSAARAFADKLYYPYDRLGLVTFDQYANIELALSENIAVIRNRIRGIKVFEGKTDVWLTNGITQDTACIYYRDDPALNYSFPELQSPVPPRASFPNTADYARTPYGPCRLFIQHGGGFFAFDCPMAYGPKPDPSRCGSTNIGGAINMASRALAGSYPPGYSSPPENREDSIWALVLLTDGAANAAYDPNGNAICPSSTWRYDVPCRSINANDRHKSSDSLYDAQDQARDMFDVADQNNISIYTIGLGTLVKNIPPDNTGPAPGETLLQYPQTILGNGEYFFAPSGTALTPIFLAIANLITSRINQ